MNDKRFSRVDEDGIFAESDKLASEIVAWQEEGWKVEEFRGLNDHPRWVEYLAMLKKERAQVYAWKKPVG